MYTPRTPRAQTSQGTGTGTDASDLERERADIDRELVRRRGFREFVKRAWSHVEPSPCVWSWHMDAICEHLEAVTRGEVLKLVINVPPGHSKSLLANVLWPAWEWSHSPEQRYICATFDSDLATRDARKMRSLVTSDWYRARWQGVEIPNDRTASTAVTLFVNTAGGFRNSVTVRGGVTGKHAHKHIIDDPIDPTGAAAHSGIELDYVINWHGQTMSTRFVDPKCPVTVLIMQRVHQRDLAAKLIASGATVLCLPMRYERHHPHRYARDPRTREGELLDARRHSEETVTALETELGPSQTAAQLQQRPSPAGGGIIKRDWLKNYWTVLPSGGTWSQSWDCSFKGKSDSDFVCGQVWYHHGANHYLVDQVLARMGFNDTLRAIEQLSARYPRAIRKLIEDKANGPAIIETLRASVSGLVEINPEGGKEARARACEPLFAAGNVFLPHPTRAEYDDGRRGAEWVRGGVALDAEEAAVHSYEWFMVTFPNADHDDVVDATTQYLIHSAGSFAQRMKAAVEKAAPRNTSALAGLHGLATVHRMAR